MGRKFKYLILSGLKKKFTSKPFIITNIIMVILFIGIINLNNIIKFFGGDFLEENTLKIHLVDNTDKYKDTLSKYLTTKYIEDVETFDVSVSDKSVDELNDKLDEKDNLIIEVKEENDLLFVNIISKDSIDSNSFQAITTAVNMSKYEVNAKESNISEKDLNKLNTPANIEKIVINKADNDKEEENKKIMEVLFPIFILPFYILIIQLINNIGSEINEEKSSKSMEVIISSISAKTHFYSKIVSNNIFVISQMILFILYGLIGIIINNAVNSSPIFSFQLISALSAFKISSDILLMLPLLFILIISTFITYSLLTGILVSMTVNNEDLQHVQGPLILISLIGYYLAIGAGFMQGSVLINALSYVPLISCFLAPGLLITGQTTIISFIISILTVIGFNFLLARFGIRIYKIGILNYSTDKMWRKIFKAVRE